MTRLERLMFTVGLIDKASGPASKLQQNFDKMNKQATTGMAKVSVGAAGLFATGYALNSLLQPQREMARAMGEVRSLGATEEALKALEDQALSFSMKYGQSASDFVSSAYDIQSAIAGLAGDDLAKFTNAGNILAKGTKSDAATITNYMGTMYGIFKDSAEKMGKSTWAEQLVGQTAVAVKMFKTTGSGMSDAFKSVGANAQAAGISMAEQIGVLGTLQATMPGAEAGSKYKAFLSGVGKAQGELGLKFTDSQGKMLPMVQILDRIKGKYGDIDTVAKSDLMKKAFGSEEAVSVLKLLASDSGTLAKNIAEIAKQSGLDAAIEMAGAMTDPMDRLAASTNVLIIMLGKGMAPLILPLVNGLIWLGDKVRIFAKENPILAKTIGVLTVFVFGLAATIALLSMAVGVGKFMMIGWGVVTAIASGVMTVMSGALKVMYVSWWLLNSAMLANPITWIVLGIIALIGVVYLVVKHWDALKQSFMDYGPFGMVLKGLGWMYDKLKALLGLGGSVDIDANLNKHMAESRGAAPSLNAPMQSNSVTGGKGLMQEYSQISKTNNGPRIDKVIINTQKVDDQNLVNLAMSG